MSTGQLLRFSRAILRNDKVVVLDEAISSRAGDERGADRGVSFYLIRLSELNVIGRKAVRYFGRRRLPSNSPAPAPISFAPRSLHSLVSTCDSYVENVHPSSWSACGTARLCAPQPRSASLTDGLLVCLRSCWLLRHQRREGGSDCTAGGGEFLYACQ